MKTPQYKSLRHHLTLIACLFTLTSCTAAPLVLNAAPLVLNVEDAVVMPGRQTHFYAWLGQGRSMAFKREIKNAVIRFYVNGVEVAQAVTDREGQAAVSCELPSSNADAFVAKTEAEGLTTETRGSIYHWSNNKTIVAVDIDETISDTKYSDLFITNIDKNSKPIGNSRDVLEQMAKDYQIFYFSARPRFLHEKTKQWLQDQNFPMGPIAHASKFEACLRQTTYKKRMLADLRNRYPNMLIGIGDRTVDDKAFGSSHMLTVLVNPSRLGTYNPRCVLCKDWDCVRSFFSKYRAQLSNPRNALAVIDDKANLNRPVLLGEPTGPSVSAD